jgi:hypothetical protein
MVDTIIKAGIAYSFYAIPYSMPSIKKLDKKIIAYKSKSAASLTIRLMSPLNYHITSLE